MRERQSQRFANTLHGLAPARRVGIRVRSPVLPDGLSQGAHIVVRTLPLQSLRPCSILQGSLGQGTEVHSRQRKVVNHGRSGHNYERTQDGNYHNNRAGLPAFQKMRYPRDGLGFHALHSTIQQRNDRVSKNQGSPVIEKRLHPRKPVSIPVKMTFEATQAQVTGVCIDISMGGMFVETETKGAFGDNLSVQVDAPGSPLTFPAVVRWTSPSGMGLQFGLVGARETHAIAQWMSGKH